MSKEILAVYELDDEQEVIIVLMRDPDTEETSWDTARKLEFNTKDIEPEEEEEEEEKPLKRRKRGKRKSMSIKPSGPNRPFSLKREYKNDQEDITMIRKWFSMWKRTGNLEENEISALEAIGQIKFDSLSDGQREQLLIMFNEVRKRITEKNKL